MNSQIKDSRFFDDWSGEGRIQPGATPMGILK
jgi:hypothetical protein